MKKLHAENHDMFAWSHDEMPENNNTVIEHHLYVNPNAKKVQKKCRSFNMEKYAAIAEKVDRLLATWFI